MQTRIADGGKCKEQDGQGLSLASLIARLEKATGANRELDCRIHALVLDTHPGGGRYCVVGQPTYYDEPRHFFSPDPEMDWIGYDLLNVSPHYTSSIDAAMTLVPGGFAIRDWMIWPGQPCQLTLLETHLKNGERWHGSPDRRWPAKAATPAIALCIAALKAVAETRRNAPGDAGLLSGVTSEQTDSTP